ncbi:NADH dehydrogenase subunit N [Spirosomataceae bacterium TFI 002]|nr:NADH dehydrogenase subunit N [Spirosomataceae bacterium TFI 002]
MYPIIALSITGLITLFLGFSAKSKQLLLPSVIAFLSIAFAVNFIDWNAPGLYFSEMVKVDNFNLSFTAILIATAILIVCLSDTFKNIEYAHPAEYFAIIQFSLVGAIMMVTFQNLIMLFLGIEILSVSMYVLTGADKRNIRGNEAAIKYFLMGAFATGIFLFGVAMIYGGTGSFDITTIASYISINALKSNFLLIGITFLMIGLLFKVSAAPFHWWTADVYEGAPTIFTTYMSTIVKTAGFVAIFKMASQALAGIGDFMTPMLIIMIVSSLLIGNIAAAMQASFKRMLAFSSISHAGYMLLPILGLNEMTGQTLIFYSIAYSFATISAFGVLMVVSKEDYVNGRPNEQISVFDGLFKRNSFLAVVLIIALLSLAGIPLTAGFWGKFFAFQDIGTGKYMWVLIFAIVSSAVGILYYFKPILASFKQTEASPSIHLKPIFKIIFIITTIGTLAFGIFPDLAKILF